MQPPKFFGEVPSYNEARYPHLCGAGDRDLLFPMGEYELCRVQPRDATKWGFSQVSLHHLFAKMVLFKLTRQEKQLQEAEYKL